MPGELREATEPPGEIGGTAATSTGWAKTADRRKVGREDEMSVYVSAQWETSTDSIRKGSDQETTEESVKVLRRESIRKWRWTTYVPDMKSFRNTESALKGNLDSTEENLLGRVGGVPYDLCRFRTNIIAMTYGCPGSMVTHHSKVDLFRLAGSDSENRKHLAETPWKNQKYPEIDSQRNFQFLNHSTTNKRSPPNVNQIYRPIPAIERRGDLDLSPPIQF